MMIAKPLASAVRRNLARRTTLNTRDRAWAVATGGAALTGLAAPRPIRWVAAGLGALSLYRGIRGRSYVAQNLGLQPAERGTYTFAHTLSIFRPAEEVRRDWERLSGEASPLPAGRRESLPGGVAWTAPHACAKLSFRPELGGKSTVVRLEIAYRPFAGALGAAASRLTGSDLWWAARRMLREFKQRAETGEVPTTEGQPSGKEAAA